MAIKLQTSGHYSATPTIPERKNGNESNEILTQGEAAQFLKISVDLLRRATEEKVIPFRRLGSRILYGRQALLRWVNCEN